MENPMLTFVSPTVIVGDKSQVYVAAHEMAHSWTGNLVTCADWANFWLNEGFTVFAQRKSAELIDGLDFTKVSSFIGNQSAYEAMETYGYWDSYSSLHPNVRTAAPDDSFSVIPYEKGFQLLYYIQSLLGDKLMADMVDEYIFENKYTSIKWQVFQAKVESFVDKHENAEVAREIKAKIDWEAWVYGPGLAPIHQDFTTPLLLESQAMAEAYIVGGGSTGPSDFRDYLDNKKFYSNLRVIFQQYLVQNEKRVTGAIMKKIDQDLGVTTHSPIDYNVFQQWIPLGLRTGYLPVRFIAQEICQTVGRMKYLIPIYTALLKSGQKELALEWYHESFAFYSPYAQSNLLTLINSY